MRNGPNAALGRRLIAATSEAVDATEGVPKRHWRDDSNLAPRAGVVNTDSPWPSTTRATTCRPSRNSLLHRRPEGSSRPRRPVGPCTPQGPIPGVPVREWVYNDRHQLASERHPESGPVTYAYDANGWVHTKQDARETTHTYTYDGNGRVVTDVATRGGATVGSQRFTYNEYDRPVEATNGGVTTVFTYKANGRWPDRKTVYVNGRSYSVRNEQYDHLGQVTKLVYPSGWCVRYDHDYVVAGGQVSKVWEHDYAIDYARNIAYHANGAVKSYLAGNGITHVIDQDARGRTSRVRSTLVDVQYRYDDRDNVLQVVETHRSPTRTQDFQYDRIDRLTWMDGSYGSNQFEYDAMGNRTASGGPPSNSEVTIDPLTFRVTAVDAVSYLYHADGSLQSGGAPPHAYTRSRTAAAARSGGTTSCHSARRGATPAPTPGASPARNATPRRGWTTSAQGTTGRTSDASPRSTPSTRGRRTSRTRSGGIATRTPGTTHSST